MYKRHHNIDDGIPQFCIDGIGHPGYHCLKNDCSYFSHTYCPYELAYTGKDGKVLSGDNFSALCEGYLSTLQSDEEREKVINEWEILCKEKIYETQKFLDDG